MKKSFFLFILLATLPWRLLALTVASPDGSLVAHVELDASRNLTYTVTKAGHVVIATSRIGVTVDGVDWGRDVHWGARQRRRIEQEYPMLGGKSLAQDVANTIAVALSRDGGGAATLELRAYDNGFAWRLVIPGPAGQSRRVSEEASTWTLPAGSRVWLGERNNDWKLKSYAGEWRVVPVGDLPVVSQQGPVQAPPLVVELPQGGYALVTEAALENYSGLRLRAIGHETVQADFTEGASGFAVAGEIVTPWRVTLVNADLDGLVNNTVVANLNPPPDRAEFADTSYIRPGRAVWRWWSRGTGTPAEEQQFVDYAAKLGFEYSLIDEGWEKWPSPWADLARVVAHGRERNVGVFVWKNYKEIADPADDWAQLRGFLDGVRVAGVAGVKIDYINAESTDRIAFEVAVRRETARRRLMVDFHGLQKPTGESRTWPNEISREAIRGLELNRMSEGPITAAHNAALPFTRLVVGPGDYTPLGYSRPGATSWAHQLATVVQFTSPLQVLAEDPEMLLHDPATQPALDVLKAIPTVWDETRVLPPSRIGELSIIARRSGTQWFLAILNGRSEATAIKGLALTFLGSGGYHAVQLTSPDAHRFARREFAVTRSTPLDFSLAAGDGAVVWLQRVPTRAVTLDLAGAWKFALDPLNRGEAFGWSGIVKLPGDWDYVMVPHDFLTDPRYAYTGVAWYACFIAVPADGGASRAWQLEFDEVFQRCRVWCNGELVGTHEGGYAPFRLSLAGRLRPGSDNLIVVAVDNRIKERALPGARSGSTASDAGYPWLNYGGILGGARLVGRAEAWIESQRIATRFESDGSARIEIDASVRNDGAVATPGAITAAVTDERGKILPVLLTGACMLPAHGTAQVRLEGRLPVGTFNRWTPAVPQLYCSRVSLTAGAMTDESEATFGFRSVETRDGRFLVNGEPVRMLGANRARGNPLTGGIDTDDSVRQDLGLMAEAGLRFSRLQHTAPGRNALEWADRHGLLLVLEAGNWGYPAADLASEELRAQFRAEMRELMQLAWNHPSVVGWSLGNEYESWTPEGIAWTKDMAAWVREIDPTRPVTFSAVGRALRELRAAPAGTESAFDAVDFISTNLYFPVRDMPAFIDPLHLRWPDKPVFVSEFGLRSDQVKSERERMNQFDAMLDWVRPRGWICGLSFWSFNDYASRYPGTGADGYRRWGLVDEFRKPRALYEHVVEIIQGDGFSLPGNPPAEETPGH